MRKIAFLVLMLGPTNLHAQEVPKDYNAETMLNLCRGTAEGETGMQSMVCTFRIQGVTSIMIENCLSVDNGFEPLPALASGRPPSRGAARQAFVNFMDANPDKWGLPWHVALSLALSDAFPCEV